MSVQEQITTETLGQRVCRRTHGGPLGLRACVARRPNGFSLIEMLVVIAIASVLLGLVIAPIITTFNFTNRARRNVEVQDAARYAMEVASREIADAMGVVVSPGDEEPFLYYTGGAPGKGEAVVVRGLGALAAYDENGSEFDLPNAMIDLVLPHDSLNLEGGKITQPLAPQHTTASDGTEHPIIVRYFVGLADPAGAKRNASGAPMWQNNFVLSRRGTPNMYTLYRVEFDPYDKNIANWAIPDPDNAKTADGKAVWILNPRFFYDRTVGPSGLSAAAYWRKKSVAIMPTDTIDLVDFVRGAVPNGSPRGTLGTVTEARSLVTFNPLVVAADAAGAQGDNRQPATYKVQYGHWTGLQNNGTVSANGFSGGVAGVLPHIMVYNQERDENGLVTLASVFDSAQRNASADDSPSKRNRILSWNSLKGTVEFSLAAPDYDSEKANNVPSTSVFDPLNTTPGFTPPPGAYITPGSEIVTVWEDDPDDPGNSSKYRPVVYSRSSSATKDIYEVPEEVARQSGAPQQLPPPRTYIVSSSGKIIIGYPYPSVTNPVQPQPVPSGHRVTISYFVQNNKPDDLVKVDYLTREMLTINLTARTYDPVTRNPITTTLSNKVRIRNTQR